MIGERFLPIGTIVLLKGGKRELMIMSHCIVSEGEAYDKTGKIDVDGKLFDYGGCVYPQGMLTSDQLFAFDHHQIEKVVYMGYETDSHKDLSKFLNAARNKYDKKIKKEAKDNKEEPKKDNKEDNE